MIYGCEKFRPYLIGRPFIAETDHSALQWLMNCNKPGRLTRWSLRLAEYDFTVKHRPGVTIGHVDSSSRHPVHPADDSGSFYDPLGHDLALVNALWTSLNA